MTARLQIEELRAMLLAEIKKYTPEAANADRHDANVAQGRIYAYHDILDCLARLSMREKIVSMLREVEADDTIEAWFHGLNTMLGDRTPESMLAVDPEAVYQAAHCFRAYG